MPSSPAIDPAAIPSCAEVEQALAWSETIVDVRTPAEYARGHLPEATNFPLFADVERAQIGLIYRLQGQQAAVQRGLSYLGERLSGFVTPFYPLKARRLLVYCARGGMRSRSVCGLLQALGFTVHQLPGGYKTYRQYLLQRLEKLRPRHLLVLCGLTGVGKTELLTQLENHLDLEALAAHRGSLFGGIGLEPRTQQNFEAHLLQRLEGLDLAAPVWVEAESRCIGNVTLPASLHQAIHRAPAIWIEAPMSERVQRIVNTYQVRTLPPKPFQEALAKLSLPAVTARSLQAALQRGAYAPVVEALLRLHYDRRYRRRPLEAHTAAVSSSSCAQALRTLRDLAARYPKHEAEAHACEPASPA